MKCSLCILSSILATTLAIAQPYGNEWIDYSQKYLKFQVIEDGVYKVTYNDLYSLTNSIGMDTIDPAKIQVWGRGKQQYIHIDSDDGDNVLEPNESIEFYAKSNDGWLDSLLYDEPGSQVNPYFSLYNDTATYYITFSNSPSLRYTDIAAASIATPDDYFLEEVVKYSSQQYWRGVYSSGTGKHDVEYTAGEGWFYSAYGATSHETISINTPNASNNVSAPDAIVETQYAGVNNPGGSISHHVEVFYNNQTTPVISNPFASFNMFNDTFSIPLSQISANTDIRFANGPSVNSSAKSAVAYVKITYPRTYASVLDSIRILRLPANSAAHQINLPAFYSPFNKTFVYDFENNTRTTISGSSVEFTMPSGPEKDILVFSNLASVFSSPVNLSLASGDGSFRDYLANSSEEAFLIVTGKSLKNEAIEYAEYRASANGGNSDTIVAIIDELYDQFAYGVHKHPISIRYFSDYLLDNLPTAPSNLFLIGKSIVYTNSRNIPSYYSQNIVPTMGNPPTDNLFTSRLNGTSFECAIPTGRLSALNGSDVLLYLDKVIALEANQLDTTYYSIADKAWMKHIIHFGGGNGVIEQGQLAGYLESYAETARDSLFGAYIDSFYKNSSSVIQDAEFNDIKTWIEGGASIITFFGHSSAQGFDLNLDNVNYYNNEGRYPIFNAFGCQTGNIHNYIENATQARTTSEDFILTANRGAIGFLASTDAGLQSNMNDYASEYYENIAYDNYGQSIGEIIKATVVDYQNPTTAFSFNNNKSTCYEMSLHGDPSIKINPHSKPDYAVELNNVTFSPEEVSTASTTFTMNIEVINLGRGINKEVPIEIIRYVDGVSLDTILDVMPPINYSYTYQVDLQTGTGGLNAFDIRIDRYNTIAEINNNIYNNNLTSSGNRPELYISSDNLIPIFPYNYAVIGNPDITLKASTAELFAASRAYTIQIDLNDKYNSNNGAPLDQTIINQSGGVVSWKPNFGTTLVDSAVYYWRCAPSADTSKWREHSFQYISGKTGWGQDDFFQFKNDEFWVINHNRPDVQFEFDTLTDIVSCQTVSNANNIPEYNNTYFRVNGEKIKDGICGATSALYVAVFDSLTLKPWEEYYIDAQGVQQNLNHNFGSKTNFGCWNGQSSPMRCFVFPSSSQSWIQNFVDMLTTGIPDGNYVLVYTARSGNFADTSVWTQAAFNAIESYGCDQLSSGGVLNPGITGDTPFIFFAKKGDNNFTTDTVGLPNSILSLNGLKMQSLLAQGYIESSFIGPATEWGPISWKHSDDEPNGLDTVDLSIYTYDLNKTLIDTFLFSNKSFDSILNFDAVVSAQEYPFLKLRAHIYDDNFNSSGQLERWHVLYNGIPEAALDPHTFFSFVDDTLKEGQDLEISIAIENVSQYCMDTLRVSYWIDKDGATIPINYPLEDSLGALEFITDKISYKTLGVKEGINTLWIEVNPEDERWQLEQYHFNNIARKTFYVERDITNPLLDVTFDGIRILDGDVVSPEPNIVIELKDENEYIAINDTSSFDLYITDPEGVQTLLNFTGADPIIFTEATLPDNRAQVEYTPTFKTDGVYVFAVQGKDGSGNNAGDFSYSISFEVINKSTITEIMNYPNPFSTSTRFVFVLTGSKIPDQFKIQVLTVSGRVVREITEDEIGPINIGRNVTEYAWNGTDEFGDPLANGVYLYRVITKIEGEDIEHRSTEADNFFHKGFGKMYLMR